MLYEEDLEGRWMDDTNAQFPHGEAQDSNATNANTDTDTDTDISVPSPRFSCLGAACCIPACHESQYIYYARQGSEYTFCPGSEERGSTNGASVRSFTRK
jgi:hypothetical protein